MDLRSLLQQAAQATGISALELEPGEACELELQTGEKVVFELTAGGDRLYCYAVVMVVGPQAPAALYRRALALNLFGRETGDLTLALDEGRGELLVFGFAEAGEVDLAEMAGRVAAVRGRCREVLQEVLEQEEAEAAPSDGGASASLLRV